MARTLLSGFFLLAALIVASPATPQATGEISGTVLDATGSVLPGVLVTLTSPVLLQPQISQTGETGTYRFPRLAIGVYRVSFELGGFRGVVREDIKVEIGFTATVNAVLELSGVQETVTVAGDSPIVDAHDASRGARFPREALDGIPTSRDPYAMITQTPGVQVSDVNVGGNLSGQQLITASRGDWGWNNTWLLDGVDITDIAATGSSSIYYDFGSFQEMQITTSGGATQQTSGVAVNLVTRAGTDTFHGSARLFVTDDALEAQNVDQELRSQNAGAGNPIKNIKDLGLEAGGPLKPGRAWIWGSYGRQDIEVGVVNFYKKEGDCAGLTDATAIDYPLDTVRDCLQPDLTSIWAASAKAQLQATPRNRISFFMNLTEKIRPHREASDVRPVETTVRQAGVPADYGPRLWKTGPSSLWKVGDQHIFSNRWLLDVQWAHQGANFAADFQDPALASEQPRYDLPAGLWSRSYARAVNVRPVDSVTVVTDYFRPSTLGGDHAITAGWRWRAGQAYAESHWGGNTVARYRNGVAAEANLYRDAATSYQLDTQAAWLQETYTRRRLTINAGLRWDHQYDSANASSVPGHPFQGQMTAQGTPFNWLPPASFAGAGGGPAWNDFAPRVGLTYQLSSDARTTAKVSYARYHAQRTAGWLSGTVNPMTEAMIRFPWRDANGDGYVQVGELDTTRILAFSGNYNPYQPGQLGTSNQIDPSIRSYKTDEVVVGLDRQIGAEFALGAAFIWVRHADASMSSLVGLTSADYVSRTFTPAPAACPEPGARCETVEYWEPTRPLPSTVFLTNRPDYDRRYRGFELTARRRMRGRWMLDASLTFNDARQYYRSARAYDDPTNIAQMSGADFAVDRIRQGNIPNAPVPNAAWIAKVAGVYTLPWDIAASGVYQARQGYSFLPSVQTPSRANSAGTVNVLLDPVGDVRHPALHVLDLSVNRPFAVGRWKLTASLEAFNVANVNTVLARRNIQNAVGANQVSTIVAPRVIRLGIRAAW